MFDTPSAGGDLFVNNEHVGDLLVIKVKDTDNIQTTASEKPSDVIIADVTVINPDGTAGDEYTDATLFGRVLYGQLKRSIGRTVLGRFELGEKKPGKHAPYVLNPAGPEDTDRAMRAMTSAPAPATAAAGSDAPPWERS